MEVEDRPQGVISVEVVVDMAGGEMIGMGIIVEVGEMIGVGVEDEEETMGVVEGV